MKAAINNHKFRMLRRKSGNIAKKSSQREIAVYILPIKYKKA